MVSFDSEKFSDTKYHKEVRASRAEARVKRESKHDSAETLSFRRECERCRLTRGAAQAEQKCVEQIQDSLLTPTIKDRIRNYLVFYYI